MALHHLALAQSIDVASPARKSLVWTLAARCDEHGYLAYDPELIAQQANMTPRSVRTHLHWLADKSLVDWTPGAPNLQLTFPR